jgi:NAD(P)-dependent dehydrogenase (short-subunit alcohol dehydrogenase family)
MEKRHVFVTGAGSGIGEAIALRFSSEGDAVTLSDISKDGAEKVASKIRDIGGESCVVTGDVSRAADVMRMMQEAREELGPVDVLVNNAGIYPSDPFLNLTEETWDKVLNINLRGVFLCSQKALPDMIARRQGWIVNIASVDGKKPGPNNAVYCASKAGVISLTRSLAVEMAPHDIRVNAVAPGWVGTPNILANDRWKEAAKNIPLGRLAEPTEIAGSIFWLCSYDARYITGEVLSINGGILMD